MTWHTVLTTGKTLGVAKDSQGKDVIRGVILAEEGPFKTPGRGEFDAKEIRNLVKLGNAEAKGLKVRFTHPDLSSDGLGKYLGRVTDLRGDTIQRDGQSVAIARGDLGFSDSAYNTPNGNLAKYVIDLTHEDEGALGMSLVVGQLAEEFRLEKNGTAKKGPNGEPLPPLWRVGSLHGVDVVDTGDATNSMLGKGLSIDVLGALPDDVVRKATQLLKTQFAGRDRAFVEEHLRAYCNRVLEHYWPLDAAMPGMPGMDSMDPGDRVTVNPGMEHDAQHRGKSGTVMAMGSCALGIQFDGESVIHKWYTAEEVTVIAEEATDPAMATTDDLRRRLAMKTRSQVGASGGK